MKCLNKTGLNIKLEVFTSKMIIKYTQAFPCFLDIVTRSERDVRGQANFFFEKQSVPEM
jgi:hypothetical protein